MDKKYWENYYKQPTNAPQLPTPFATFALENYLSEGHSLIELGCGNGRDCLYFARHDINVLAVDQAADEIAQLQKDNTLSNLIFDCADFTNLGNIGLFDQVYSRFTMHSIKEEEENRTVTWAYEHLRTGGIFLIEARGLKNELCQKGEAVPGEQNAYIYNDHYRRFIDINILNEKLTKAGFTIILSEEKPGFAPFGDTDYVFIRVVAVKK